MTRGIPDLIIVVIGRADTTSVVVVVLFDIVVWSQLDISKGVQKLLLSFRRITTTSCYQVGDHFSHCIAVVV